MNAEKRVTRENVRIKCSMIKYNFILFLIKTTLRIAQ
jgi:hypothetical protein